jgi:DNA-binding MarR family transcriptional regulator
MPPRSRTDGPTLRAMRLPSSWIERYRRLYPIASPKLVSVLFAVRSTALLLDNAYTARLTETGLTSARYHLLMVLWGLGGQVSFTDLGAFLTVTRATISALVEGLVRDGIVDREVDAKDRRNALISLTPRGEDVLKPILDNNFKDMRVAFADFTEEEMTQLLTLLGKFRSNVERLAMSTKPVRPQSRYESFEDGRPDEAGDPDAR